MGRGRPHHGNRRRGRSGGPRKQHHTLVGTLVVSRPGAAHVETPEGDFELGSAQQRYVPICNYAPDGFPTAIVRVPETVLPASDSGAS